MLRRLLVLLALPLGLAAVPPVAAQNVLPNSGFDTGIAPWSAVFNADSWDEVDSRGCPGSGAFESVCNFVESVETGLCLPFSGATAHLSFRMRSSADVPGMEGFGFFVSMFSDTGCVTDLLGFPIYVGYQNVQIPTAYSTYNLTQTLSPGTQSIRVTFDFSDMNCGPGDGIVLLLDELYYGKGEPILAHDFENGNVCPLEASPPI